MKNVLPILFVIAALLLAGLVIGRYKAQAVPKHEMAGQDDQQNRYTWHEASPALRNAVGAVITGQLDAFQKDDYQRAVLYQSRDMKQRFPDVTPFRAMIKSRYPEFADYKSVQFGLARADDTGKHVEMLVTLTGRDGVVVHADYMMVREGGIYHVEGVAGGFKPNSPPRPAHPGVSQIT